MTAITPVAGTVAIPETEGVTLQSVDVDSGTLYFTTARQGTGPAQVSAPVFVPGAAGGINLYLGLSDAKSALGVPLTAAAGTPSGAVGIARTAGTSLDLVGEATSASTKTNVGFWEFNLPGDYVAGDDLALTVNCSISGSGTLTAASCVLTPSMYTEVEGVETALTISAGQQIVAAGGDLTFTVTGDDLNPGDHLGLQLSMAIVSSSGANTGHIRSVAIST